MDVHVWNQYYRIEDLTCPSPPPPPISQVHFRFLQPPHCNSMHLYFCSGLCQSRYSIISSAVHVSGQDFKIQKIIISWDLKRFHPNFFLIYAESKISTNFKENHTVKTSLKADQSPAKTFTEASLTHVMIPLQQIQLLKCIKLYMCIMTCRTAYASTSTHRMQQVLW